MEEEGEPLEMGPAISHRPQSADREENVEWRRNVAAAK